MSEGSIVDYEAIGNRVYHRRREMALTQSTLAGRIGVSASIIGHIERAEKVASFDTIARLCRALDVSVDWLAWGERSRCEGGLCPLYRELSALLSAYGLVRRP